MAEATVTADGLGFAVTRLTDNPRHHLDNSHSWIRISPFATMAGGTTVMGPEGEGVLDVSCDG